METLEKLNGKRVLMHLICDKKILEKLVSTAKRTQVLLENSYDMKEYLIVN